MTISLTLDIRDPSGDRLPDGALVTVKNDRTVRAAGWGIVPAPVASPITVAGSDPVVTIPYANDDPAIADESQGFGLIITARWKQGTDTCTWSGTRAIDSSLGSTVSLSDLPEAISLPPVAGVDPAAISQAITDSATAKADAADAKTLAESANAGTDAGVAGLVTQGGQTTTALDTRFAASDSVYGPTDASLICAPSTGNQGLTFDGTHFWWGNDDGTTSTIAKIDPGTGTVIASYPGPTHSGGGDYHTHTGRLFFISSGTAPAALWEIDPATGAKLRSWDFSTLDYGGSAMVGIDDTDPTGNTAYILTSAYAQWDFKVSRVTLANDGTWSGAQLMLTHASLGIVQGACCQGGSFYYLSDAPDTAGGFTGGQRVTRFTPSGNTLVEDRRWLGHLTGESEGLAFYRGGLVCGMRGGALGIYRYPMTAENAPTPTTFATKLTAPGFVSGAKDTAIGDGINRFPVTLGSSGNATEVYFSDQAGAAYAVATGGFNLTFYKQVSNAWVAALKLVGGAAANNPLGVAVTGYLTTTSYLGVTGNASASSFYSTPAAVFPPNNTPAYTVFNTYLGGGNATTHPNAGTAAVLTDRLGASYALSTGGYNLTILKETNDATAWYPAVVVNGGAAANTPQGITVYTGNKVISAQVTSATLTLPEAGSGVVLASPNGTKYKITVSDAGAITATAV